MPQITGRAVTGDPGLRHVLLRDGGWGPGGRSPAQSRVPNHPSPAAWSSPEPVRPPRSPAGGTRPPGRTCGGRGRWGSARPPAGPPSQAACPQAPLVAVAQGGWGEPRGLWATRGKHRGAVVPGSKALMHAASPQGRRQPEAAHRGRVLRAHVVIVSSLGAVGLSAVGARKGGAVHLTGRLPAASLVVLVAHEAGEGSPAALGSGEGKRPERGWASSLACAPPPLSD